MNTTKSLLTTLLLAGILASSVATASAQSSGSSVVIAPGYCHKKFPAIREETLFSSRPVLKDPIDGDLIDFYGSCDYDPLSKEEIRVQRSAFKRDKKNFADRD